MLPTAVFPSSRFLWRRPDLPWVASSLPLPALTISRKGYSGHDTTIWAFCYCGPQALRALPEDPCGVYFPRMETAKIGNILSAARRAGVGSRLCCWFFSLPSRCFPALRGLDGASVLWTVKGTTAKAEASSPSTSSPISRSSMSSGSTTVNR